VQTPSRPQPSNPAPKPSKIFAESAPMPKLTKRGIDAVPADTPRKILWDSEIKGFGVIFLPSGVRSFVAQYRNANGRQRRVTLGRYGVLTVEQARKEARLVLARVAGGDDPAQEKQAERGAGSIAELMSRYLSDHAEPHNAPSTVAGAREMVRLHILPEIGNLATRAVTRQDVLRLHKAMEGTPRAANHVLAILSKAFNLAELWSLRPEGSNPCRRVQRYRENARERFLTGEELARLGQAIGEAETIGLPWRLREGVKEKHRPKEASQRTRMNPTICGALRVLVLTGARLSEILELRWADVDFENGSLALPGHKGGRRRAHPVGTAALAVIAEQPRLDGSPYVFPAPRKAGGHLSKFVVENAWQKLREHAALDDVRIHDLRHTVGTYASQTGMNAFGVRDLLRHRSIAVTGRYANSASDPIREVSETVGDRIEAALAGAAGEVVSFKRRGARNQ
jgi:integrase